MHGRSNSQVPLLPGFLYLRVKYSMSTWHMSYGLAIKWAMSKRQRQPTTCATSQCIEAYPLTQGLPRPAPPTPHRKMDFRTVTFKTVPVNYTPKSQQIHTTFAIQATSAGLSKRLTTRIAESTAPKAGFRG